MLCTQKLTLKQKRRPPLQPGRHDGCDVHGVVVVWVQLPPRHREGPDAHRVDEYLFRPVRRRVGGADAGHARARPGHHQHRRDCGAAGHVVVGGGGGGVRRQGGVSASEGGSPTLARGRGGGGGVLGVVRGEMRRGYRGGRVATMATFWYDLLLDIGGLSEGARGTEYNKIYSMATRGLPRVHSPRVEVEVESSRHCVFPFESVLRYEYRVSTSMFRVGTSPPGIPYFQQQSRGSRSRHLHLSSQLSSCFMFSRIPTPQIRTETDGQSSRPIAP